MSLTDDFERHVYRVVPNGTRWEVRKDEEHTTVVTTSDKQDAIRLARECAEQCFFGQIIVLTDEGLVEYESTCAKHRPRGPARGNA